MWEIDKHCRIKIGGCYFANCDVLISYDKKPLLTLKRPADGHLEVDFDAFDQQGKTAATIHQGHVVSGDRQRFEFYQGADRFRVTDKTLGRRILEIIKHPSDAELLVSVNMHLPDTGFLLKATPDSLNVGSHHPLGATFSHLNAGIAIGQADGKAGILLEKPSAAHRA